MRPFKPASERESEHLRIRVTTKFKSELEDRAKQLGLPVGTLIKKILREKLEID